MSKTPIRIQRKRTKGWRMPENTVYVGRPTKFGNPYTIIQDNDHRSAVGVGMWLVLLRRGRIARGYYEFKEEAVKIAISEFREYAKERLVTEPRWLDELRGKNLACFCPLTQPCHADVLLELANHQQILSEVGRSGMQ